jgi:hypothetical protein
VAEQFFFKSHPLAGNKRILSKSAFYFLAYLLSFLFFKSERAQPESFETETELSQEIKILRFTEYPMKPMPRGLSVPRPFNLSIPDIRIQSMLACPTSGNKCRAPNSGNRSFIYL